MKITGVDKSLLPDSISISGTMYGTSKAKKKYRGVEVPFTFVVNAVAANPFSSDGGFSVDFHLNIEPKDTDVVDRLYISASSPQEEKVFGHGMQYSSINHKGKKVPIFISEQGIGRGLEPITGFLNTFVGGAGGNTFTTYGSKPIFMSDMHRGAMLFNSEAMIFDWSAEKDKAVEIEVWNKNQQRHAPVDGRLFYWPNSPMEFVEMLTEYTGRMSPLPSWSQEGAIIGLEGGSDMVNENMNTLISNNVAIKGLWLQDWTGHHHSYDGDRLKWNWILSRSHYPDWKEMTSRMDSHGIRMMTYVNPYFQSNLGKDDDSEKSLFAEGNENGYFIKKQGKHGTFETYLINSGSIKFGCLDVTNPDAVAWYKNIIKEMVEETGCRGWMSDFGEAVPFDGVMHDGSHGIKHHNAYPEFWQDLNREAVAELNMTKEIVFFSRSAYNKSPGKAQVFWVGDQLVSWDMKDGLQTVAVVQQSSGLTGHSISGSDIGGYTMTNYPLAHYERSAELFQRWTELEAFSGSLFRTHLGSSMAENNSQVWDDANIPHFKKFTDIWVWLKDYRHELFLEAEERGSPLVRSLFMTFPNDPATWGSRVIAEQFMFGDEFLVAPVMKEGATKKDIYFPAAGAKWVSIWDGAAYTSGSHETVQAPIGNPPVFYKEGSKWGESLAKYLAASEAE